MSDIRQLSQIDSFVERCLGEDPESFGWSNAVASTVDSRRVGRIYAGESTVIAGLDVCVAVFKKLDHRLAVRAQAVNGRLINAGDEVLEVSGSARAILKAQRVALQNLAYLSGIAGNTRRYVQRISDLPTTLLVSRRTTPGLRALEKSAALAGGAFAHKLCMSEGVLVSRHHWTLAGGITRAVSDLLESLAPTIKVEVEIDRLDQVAEAIDAGADTLVVSEMTPAEIAMVVRVCQNRVRVEATGQIGLGQLREVAITGVDAISTDSIIAGACPAKFFLNMDVA